MLPGDVAEAYRGRRVLVTGGLGFIGSNLAHKLVELGAEVVLVVTVTTSSTWAAMWAKQRSPGRPTAMPSAIVAYDSSRTGRPAFNDGGTAAAPAACTPIDPDGRVGRLGRRRRSRRSARRRRCR